MWPSQSPLPGPQRNSRFAAIGDFSCKRFRCTLYVQVSQRQMSTSRTIASRRLIAGSSITSGIVKTQKTEMSLQRIYCHPRFGFTRKFLTGTIYRKI